MKKTHQKDNTTTRPETTGNRGLGPGPDVPLVCQIKWNCSRSQFILITGNWATRSLNHNYYCWADILLHLHPPGRRAAPPPPRSLFNYIPSTHDDDNRNQVDKTWRKEGRRQQSRCRTTTVVIKSLPLSLFRCGGAPRKSSSLCSVVSDVQVKHPAARPIH